MSLDVINTYGILAGNVVNLNSGASKDVGDLGSFNTVTGTGTISVSGQTNIGSNIANAISNASQIYTLFMNHAPDATDSSANIAGKTYFGQITALTNPGITISGSTPQITLSGAGTYVFQLPNGGLTTDPTSAPVSINYTNGAQPSQVYWIVNGNVNLQTVGNNITSFGGTIICSGNITMGLSSSSAGGLIAFSSSPSGIVTLNGNTIVSQTQQSILDNIISDYIILETNLSDNKAIQINAANSNGGIFINAGFGGIAVNTTNAISLNANAGSNLSTTLGNVALQSQPALVNIDGGNGINIGCDNDLANTNTVITTPTINIGTSTSAKTIDIGNSTSTTAVNITSGTGNVNIFSGTASTGSLNMAAGSGGISVGNDGVAHPVTVGNTVGATSVFVAAGTGGINIGGDGVAHAVNIGNTTGTTGVNIYAGTDGISIGNDGVAHAVTMGNTVGATSVFMAAGTGGINIGGDGVAHAVDIGNATGASSLNLFSGTGGIVANSGTGQLELASTDTAVDAIRLDSSGSSGGIFMAAGSQGVSIGNDGVAHPIVIGNTTGTTAVIVQSGSFGIAIGNDGSSGEVQIASGASVAKTVQINNSLSGSRLVTRWESGGWIKHQNVPTSIPSGNYTMTVSDLLIGLLVDSNVLTANVTITLPDASTIVSTISSNILVINDALDLSIINASTASNFDLQLTMGANGTMIGNNLVYPISNTGFSTSGSALFRLVITNVSTPAYTVYRIS